MGNSEIKNVALAYNELFKSTRHFDELRENIDKKRVNDSFEQAEIETIKKEYQQRLEAIEKFEREFDKFEKFLPPEIFKQLKEALRNEKSMLKSICENATSYLDSNDNQYLTALIEGFDKEKNTGEILNKEMLDFSTDLGFNLLKQAIEDKITLEDLKLMAAAFENDSALYERIKFTIDYLERRKKDEKEKEEAKDEEKQDEAEAEKKDGEAEMTPDSAETTGPDAEGTTPEETQEETKPTLQEKIDNINYKLGANLNAEVQELTVDGMLESLQAQIEALEGKEKLTVRETFKLRQLKEQELGFQAYKESLEEQKVSGKERRRNKKLDNTLGKIDDKEDELKAAIAQSQMYSSKTLRFFSSRYQQKLNDQLKALRDKQGMLTDMQKYSAVARFDKQAKKIMKRAKRKGTIDQLKAFRNSILDEINNIGEDFMRFSSTREQDMQELEQATIIMPDTIISLDEYRAQLEQARAM